MTQVSNAVPLSTPASLRLVEMETTKCLSSLEFGLVSIATFPRESHAQNELNTSLVFVIL